MGAGNEASAVSQSQRTYARLAGFVMLATIVLALGSGVVLSKISGDGSFPETAARITASERVYRVALSCVVIVSLSSTLLAFALDVTLKRVNSLLAQLGLIFCLADSLLALVVRMCSFVRLHLYVSAGEAGSGLISAAQWSDLLRTIAATTETMGGISFGIGSCLFFYLFLTSRYIPKVVALLGCAASSIWTALHFAGLIFPERHTVFGSSAFHRWPWQRS